MIYCLFYEKKKEKGENMYLMNFLPSMMVALNEY